jgi:calcium-dependent protein kinase
MHQILSAVSYCHQRGVIHKDLKPENVMMANEKGVPLPEIHCTVVDFGLAEVFKCSQERLKEVAGTPPFMAPEVWKGSFNRSCDVWSSGCILFFLLSGQLPFMAKQLHEWPAVVLQEPKWSYIGGASPGAQNICWRMLTKSERHRPSAQQLLLEPQFNGWFMQHGLAESHSSRPEISKQHLKGLMKADGRSNFEKFITRLVATQLDAGQQRKVNDAFKAFDRDGDGVIAVNELVRGLITLGAPPEKAQEVARELDVGNTGKISYSEFLAGVMDIRSKTPKERDGLLMVAWRQFNPDKRGEVPVGTIQDVLVARGMTVAELPVEFLRALEKGSSGMVTFEDFKKAMDIDESRLLMQSLCTVPRA